MRTIKIFLSVILFLIIILIAFFCLYFNNKNITCKNCNVVLISLDTLRPDHLNSYGYHKSTTPAIDQFAKESILFENAFSQASYTLPSHVSLLTSEYADRHGVYKWDEETRIKSSDKLLPEILKNQGYSTFGADIGGGLVPSIGFSRGFDFYEYATPATNEDAYEKESIPSKLSDFIKNNPGKKFLFFHARTIKGVPLNFSELQNFDEKPEDNLFFKKDFWKELDKLNKNCLNEVGGINYLNLTRCSNGNEWQRYFSIYKSINGVGDLTSSDLNNLNKHAIAYYDWSLSSFDKLFSSIHELLKINNLLSNTIIIITSDHGTAFMEHGKLSYGMTTYDEATHIPLIIYLPNYFNAKGLRIKNQIQQIDIMPTILDLLGIQNPKQTQGKSLVPLIKTKGNNMGIKFDKYIYSEGSDKNICVRTVDWKLIRNSDESLELYDLKNDPKELNNVFDKFPNTTASLKNVLTKFYLTNYYLKE